ncbi:hypothetical protein M422DRAFT_778398 [Sphaerobolus stellatus SS14]|nr:hypothetical protein M422DRAFT_778398 [Sphaerobolus stellatus SS14]
MATPIAPPGSSLYPIQPSMSNMVPTQTQAQQPTLIRIKRKRTDEPLDALVVESKSRRKKSRGVSGFFQFAGTVEQESFWEDPDTHRDLKERISTLENDDVTGAQVQVDKGKRPAREIPARRYTIVQKPSDKTLSTVPEAEASASSTVEDYTMYDAVLDDARNEDETVDPEMEKFLPMLKAYLTMNDEPANIINSSSSAVAETEYVYDLFYHRPSVANWAAAATNIATVSGLPTTGKESDDEDSEPGDSDDEDSNTEDFYRNDYPDEDPDSDNSHHLSDYDDDAVYSSHDEFDSGEEELKNVMSWRRG